MDKVGNDQTTADPGGRASAGPLRILIIDDNPRDMELCIQTLKNAGIEFQEDIIDNQEDFTAKLQSTAYDLILSDYRLPTWSGADAFRQLRQSGKDIPFILITGTLGEEAAVDLIKEGIADYILKDRLFRLPSAVVRALHEKSKRDEHQQAIKALQISEARLQRLVDSSIIGIGIGTLDGKLIDGNNSFLKLLGYTREEMLSQGLRWDKMTPSEYREVDQRAVEQLAQFGVAPAWEKEFIRKDGSRVAVLIGVVTLTTEQGDMEAISFVVDISERKLLERQLRQAQKMEAIGQLAGGVAHDFNNLLSVIIGYSEILLDQPSIGGKMHAHCEEIKRAGERAASLTRQLLAFSRQQVLTPVMLNLNTVVTETQKMLTRLIGEDIELRTVLDPTLGSVKADPGQIEQIIMNLAVNARDAMPGGGKLVIETSNVELDGEYAFNHQELSPGRYVLLSVSDSGIGMGEATKSHIFEPFFTTKEVGKGTGLGLSTVYGVVKQSGGYVWVDSELGLGSVFKIYLPLFEETVPHVRPNELRAERFPAEETILLVEDEESVRALTRHLLEEAGYTVLEAASGMQALVLAAKYPGSIHLLLTDVVMPGMNGRTLAEKMNAARPEICTLYMSGYTGGFTHSELLDARAVLVQKPFSRSTLLQQLRETLDTRKESLPSRQG